jgi:PadR family transcriptional regulator PadR
MNANNAKSQMRKGMLEYCVLLLLKRGTAYANDIITKLEEAELIVVEGTLYPLLSRMKRENLLGYEWKESTQGPPRKYYCLTEEGEALLLEMDEAWKGLVKTVGLLKEEENRRNDQ